MQNEYNASSANRHDVGLDDIFVVKRDLKKVKEKQVLCCQHIKMARYVER
jgi:hypothetical protein